MYSNTSGSRIAAFSPLFALVWCSIAAAPSWSADPNYATAGVDGCMACHNTPEVNQILKTPHARQADKRTPFANHGCESCHGPSGEHVSGAQSGGKRPPPHHVLGTQAKSYPLASVEEQNGVCLACHTNRGNQDWHGSQHQFADLSCSSCHTLHGANDPVLEKTSQAAVCYLCHTEQRAQAHRPFGHPVTAGSMTCGDCHNPHGAPGPALLTENTVNETCYRCHAEKRGPFLWEHQPVREDCMNCHDAHGTNQPAMLKVRAPFLCNMCHSENFHPSTLLSGTGAPPVGVNDNLLGRSCSNCHSQVHGSNHPSGTGLTR
jgi:DmsE family decaheme c-type cytochrome